MPDSSTSSDDAERLVVGRISGVYGVKGWVKVHSDTEPRQGITGYSPWYLRKNPHGPWRAYTVEAGRPHGKTIIAKLEGCDDRDLAQALAGAEIAIDTNQLAELGENEYYWRDLVGMRVVNTDDVELGIVSGLMETGANDVLVVADDDGRERLVPWTFGLAVLEVDTKGRCIRVDWDPDF